MRNSRIVSTTLRRSPPYVFGDQIAPRAWRSSTPSCGRPSSLSVFNTLNDAKSAFRTAGSRHWWPTRRPAQYSVLGDTRSLLVASSRARGAYGLLFAKNDPLVEWCEQGDSHPEGKRVTRQVQKEYRALHSVPTMKP